MTRRPAAPALRTSAGRSVGLTLALALALAPGLPASAQSGEDAGQAPTTATTRAAPARHAGHPFHATRPGRRGPVKLAMGSTARSPFPGQRLAGRMPLPAGAQRPTRVVLLSIGQGELINLPVGVANVWTSNPGVADVYVSSPTQLNLYGKAFGESTVFATTRAGTVVYSATVRVSQNLTTIDEMLKEAMPDAHLKVTLVGQLAVLSGTVGTPYDSAQAELLVKGLLNPGQKVTGDEPLKISVINRLKTATPQQVMLQVRFAEVSRTLTRAIGANLSSFASNSNGMLFGLSRGANPGTLTPTTSTVTTTSTVGGTTVTTSGNVYNGGAAVGLPKNLANSTAVSLAGKFAGMSLLGSLDLGEQIGLATTLAQPNLTAMSGETAEFLAGGEFPVPMSEGLGTVTIDYKKFGVSLSYTPTVLANGNISLKVRPEVSELSSQGAVTLNGFTVPGLSVRRAETTVELGSGQSFMIGGLLSNNANHTIEKTPGAGDVPILGALFKSTNFQKGETELVIVVTPYLVKPVDANAIKLPTDGYQNPDEISEVLGHQLSAGKSGVSRPMPTEAPRAEAATPGIGADDRAEPTRDRGGKKRGKEDKKGDKNAAGSTGAAPADHPRDSTAAAPGFSIN